MTATHKSYKYELKPNNKLLALFGMYAGTARFAYNWGLNRWRIQYAATGTRPSGFKLITQLTSLKRTEFPWLYQIAACVPQQALMDLNKAFSNFFKKLTKYPKFKKKGVHDSFRLTGGVRVHRKSVRLPRLGTIRLKHTTDGFHGRVLSATISRTADRWFVSINVEQQVQEPAPVQGPVVGIDLGLHTYAVMSDGTSIKMPVLSDGTLLKRRHRQLSRKQRGSNNRKKAQLRLSRLYMRIRNQRQDFLHKLSTTLTKTKSEIVVEDLGVRDMQRSQLAAGISNAAWSEFRRQLEYKCRWYSSTFTVAPQYYPSTKRCSSCGVLRDMPLAQRTYRCEKCGLEIDRDLNAALNLKQLSRSGSGRSNALGDEALVSSLKREAGCVLHVSPVSERG